MACGDLYQELCISVILLAWWFARLATVGVRGYILFCHTWLLSLDVLLFSEGRKKRSRTGGKGSRRECGGRVEGGKKCGQDVLNEKRLYFQ